MKSTGIILTINNDIYKACIERGSIHAITIGYDNEVDFYLRGSNIFQKISWHKSMLKEGDTFNLEIAEIEKSSAHLEIEEDTNEELLARYMTLKQKIEDKL